MPAKNLALRFSSGAGLLFCLLFSTSLLAQSADAGWPNYGNDPGGTRYSSAQQINGANVGQLHLAWTYRTGAMDEKTELVRKAAFEATPILIENKLFLSTPYNHALALDPKTGKIYLSTAKYAPPATPGGRGTRMPGTFMVAVYGPK